MAPFSFRSFLLWAIWLVLLIVYVDTVHHVPGGWQNALMVLVLLVILYLAEGMEIAVATLADKQTDQLERQPAKKALAYIKRDVEWFLAQRQVFVVTIVSFMSLMTTFPVVHVPFYGPMGNIDLPTPIHSLSIDVPFWFTLVFTSFTILWWCQVFPKRLALRNSEIFLAHSAGLMLPIKTIGAINLPGPAEQLVILATRYTSYRNRSSLKPGRASFYETAVLLYGCVVDRMLTTIAIAADGSAIVTHRMLLVCIHGGRTSTSGRTHADSEFTALPDIRPLALYSCPLPEKLESIAGHLDGIFDRTDPASPLFTAHDLQGWNCDHTFNPAAPAPGAKGLAWTTNWGAPLPDRLRAGDQIDRNAPMLAVLMYEVVTPFGPGAYAKDDYFQWSSEMPCRRFTLRLLAQNNARLGFGMRSCAATLHAIPFLDETKRCRQIIDNGGKANSQFDLAFPMQGTTYRIKWEGWKT